MTVFEGFIQEWEQKRGSWEEVDSIFKTFSFTSFISNGRKMWIVIFYWASIEPSNILNKQLPQDLRFVKTATFIFGIFVIGVTFALYFTFSKSLQKVMIYFNCTIQILPLLLVEKNNRLKFKIMKEGKGF